MPPGQIGHPHPESIHLPLVFCQVAQLHQQPDRLVIRSALLDQRIDLSPGRFLFLRQLVEFLYTPLFRLPLQPSLLCFADFLRFSIKLGEGALGVLGFDRLYLAQFS